MGKEEMFKLKMLFLFYSFLSSALKVTPQHDHHYSIPVALKTSFHHHSAVVLPNDRLKDVSGSVLTAESWTRANVLAHYPATNIAAIVVGHNLLCEEGLEDHFPLILPSLKNIHYTLTRWDLHKEIKVSASFSSACLLPNSPAGFRADIAEIYIKPLLSFLQRKNSPYLVNPPSHLPTLSEKASILLNNHSEAIINLGLFNLKRILLLNEGTKVPNSGSRKLSSIPDSQIIDHFPARPTPLAPTSAPTIGSSTAPPPSTARSPLPPWLGAISFPPLSFPFAPEIPPMIAPANPPHLPPCNPPDSHGPHDGAVATPPVASVRRGLWCVAKPSVPPEALQQALDYACGKGGADCAAIQPRGRCYYPSTVVAHASYAFNSYWQKTKDIGGTCGFGGTAMLINSDPSYGRCRYTLGS